MVLKLQEWLLQSDCEIARYRCPIVIGGCDCYCNGTRLTGKSRNLYDSRCIYSGCSGTSINRGNREGQRFSIRVGKIPCHVNSDHRYQRGHYLIRNGTNYYRCLIAILDLSPSLSEGFHASLHRAGDFHRTRRSINDKKENLQRASKLYSSYVLIYSSCFRQIH